MNRLTTRIGDKVYYSKGKYAPATLCAEMQTWEIRECMKKLAAYENTGLEPEEVLIHPQKAAEKALEEIKGAL